MLGRTVEMTGLPDIMNSSSLEGKEYDTNSLLEGRGFTSTVDARSSSLTTWLGRAPKYLILGSTRVSLWTLPTAGPLPHMSSRTSPTTCLKASSSSKTPYSSDTPPAYRTDRLSCTSAECSEAPGPLPVAH